MLKMIVMMRNKVGNENDVAKMTTKIMRAKMITTKKEVMITLTDFRGTHSHSASYHRCH